MDLPDCPPGTEGYEDDGSSLPSNIPKDASKGEREFAEYLHGLKLPLENGTTGRVVEQRSRDQSGQMVYACYPCSVTLYGEYMTKTHINGRKHLSKLESRKMWPKAIYDNHPLENVVQKIETPVVGKPGVQIAKWSAAPQSDEFEFDLTVVCKIQEDLDKFLSNPLIGLEYLIEILPNEEHHALIYCCVLCTKTGHNSTMLNHLICMQHNFRYISVHFKAMYFAIKEIKPNRVAFQNVMDSLVRAIEENYGRMRPVQCTQAQWDTHNAAISRAITKREHISENLGKSFVEILDPNLMQHLSRDDPKPSTGDAEGDSKNTVPVQKKKDPSPPVVAAPSRPANYRSRKEASPQAREGSLGALSNVSSEHSPRADRGAASRHHYHSSSKYSYGHDSGHERSRGRGRARGSFGYHPQYDSRYKSANPYQVDHRERERHSEMSRPSESQHRRSPPPEPELTLNSKERRKLVYKVSKYQAKMKDELDNALKVLAYHEKNPEKHPQYPDEWKKFWNRRYKEVKAENKDPTTYDFKPEWIIFWTKRMVELHEEKMEGKKKILRKQLNFPLDISPTREPPTKIHLNQKSSPPPQYMARSRSPRRRHPSRSRSPIPRRYSPLTRRSSPHRRNPSPGYARRLSPVHRSRKISTPRDLREARHSKPREDFRLSSSRDELRPQKGRVELQDTRSKSPFSARASKGSPDRLASRNRSPQPVRGAEDLSPMSMSDDDNPKLRKDKNALSPWGDSSSSLESIGSIKRNSSPPQSRRGPSPASRRGPSPGSRRGPSPGSRRGPSPGSRRGPSPRSRRGPSPASRRGPSPSVRRAPPSARYELPKVLSKPPASTGPEDVVPVLRLLAALEDYLGPSLGPKMLDLLGEALKMEKEKANSSENILDVDEHTSLMEMCKEKLKGKVEAGLVGTAATTAAREVISRTAALLHVAEMRRQERKKEEMEAVRVKGVGAVDKAAVARQLAAALIAQGKTDVTTEELATLVDAVVGMAEAKRRAGEEQQPTTVASFLEQSPAVEMKPKGHSALTMLQAAYEEQHKPEQREEKAKLPPAKEVPVDAMDGLSDSDLKTLMQNFKDLSTDEQEGLVAYLKKLEVRDPKRVENLRQFVDFGSDETPAYARLSPAHTAASTTFAKVTSTINTANNQGGQANIPSQPHTSNVSLIDSDDDDYTVEEVFKSAFKKVKDDLKQKEMEVVQKSIQHSKPEQKESENVTVTPEEQPNSAQANADASRMLKLLQSTAGQGLFNAFSTQSPTPCNTSNTDTHAGVGAGANNVTDSTWLAQRHQNSNATAMTDNAGWGRNPQTGQDQVRLGQSRMYGDVQDLNVPSESQFSNQDAEELTQVPLKSGMQDFYQNEDMQYQEQRQYPQNENFSQDDFSQDQISQHGNFSQQDQFSQKGNFSQQNPFPQQGNFLQQHQFPKEGNFSQQNQFPQPGNFSQQNQFSRQGNFSQQDPIPQLGSTNALQLNQFSQQRNFAQRGHQDNFLHQNQFLQQGNNFPQQDRFSRTHPLQQEPFSRQSDFANDQFPPQGNFIQGQFPQSEMQNRMGANNFNSKDQFQQGPPYQNIQGPLGGYQGNDRTFGGATRGRPAGGRGRGRGGRGQYPY